MSVDINDFRKFTKDAEANKAAVPKAEPMLAQSAIPDEAQTGDSNFDKLLRVIQKELDDANALAAQFAAQTMGTFKTEDTVKGQLMYAFHQGRMKGLQEASLIPARILAESRI